MSVNCVYCGQMNANDAAVCVGCGRTLPPSAGSRAPEPPPSWGSPQPPSFGSPQPPPGGSSWPPPSDPYGTSAGQGWQPGGGAGYPPPSYPPQPPQPGSWGQSGAPQQQPNSWDQPQQPNAWGQWQPSQAPPYGQQQGVWQPAGPQFGAVPFEVSEAQSKAKTAMICALVGIVCFGVVLGSIGLGLGLKAKATLQRYGVEEGQGMATAGIVIGVIDIVLFVLGMLSTLANL